MKGEIPDNRVAFLNEMTVRDLENFLEFEKTFLLF